MKWYALYVPKEEESKVRDTILQWAKTMELTEKLGRIVIPKQKVVVHSWQGRKVSKKKIFPGYLFVQVEPSLRYLIRRLLGSFHPGVRFIGRKAVSQEEIKAFLRVKPEEPKPLVEFHVGESIRVIEGTFTCFTGVIERLDLTKGKLWVLLTLFNRPTLVELYTSQVEKNT